MKKVLSIVFYLVVTFQCVNAQDTLWTKADKKALIDNYKRTKEEINTETSNLSHSQWHFKETDTSWSIAQVIEHLNMWQLITLYNVRNMMSLGARPELAILCASDSANTSFIYQ